MKKHISAFLLLLAVSVTTIFGCASTKETIALTKAAEKLGIELAMVVCPFYNKPTMDGVYTHFKAVAESTTCKIMLYNIPIFVGINMEAEVVHHRHQRRSRGKSHSGDRLPAGHPRCESRIRGLQRRRYHAATHHHPGCHGYCHRRRSYLRKRDS